MSLKRRGNAYWILAILVFLVFQFPYVRHFFFDHVGRWVYIFLYSTSLSFALTPLVRELALKFHILDHPAERKIHKEATPLLGGLAIFISFTLALLSNMIIDQKMFVILLTGSILTVVSLLDDWRGIAARTKLAVQLIMCSVLMINGIVLEFFPIYTWWGQGLNYLLTAIWVIGITNAMNFLDGMDGLAAGVSIIISGYLCIIAFQTHQPTLGWIAIAMLGSCLGFLPYNFRKKRSALLFLGDTGSIFIGYVLAALAVVGDWSERDPIVSFATPVLIFWVLIYDMTFITVERILTGKVRTVKEWIDYVGKDHIHHRMYTLLGDKRQAVMLIFLLSLTLGVTAITLRNARTIDSVLLVIQAALITVIVSILDHFGRKRIGEMKIDKERSDD
ncbi:MAG TPA: MraY family glycosyltransferase [Syntrophales bacterium]|nr:MraY family glycosyltransferase [Syntrophales bacterium]HOL59239.1 MraY family glycosyltransferase [Syntrophales bacterium]HPO35289.1 MraY family glycosyltransferase [Syntrophales bacterium]